MRRDRGEAPAFGNFSPPLPGFRIFTARAAHLEPAGLPEWIAPQDVSGIKAGVADLPFTGRTLGRRTEQSGAYNFIR